MKEFFYDLLLNLDKIAGLKQYDKLMTSENPEKEIDELLDILARTSDQFPLIPKKDQKSILRHAVVSDGDFIGLNAKFVYKSLNAHRERYFREAAHIPDENDPNWKPLEGEERQKWLAKWMETLNGFQDNLVQTKSHVKAWEETLPRKNENAYPSTKAQDVLKAELHLQWIRENHDRDGNKLPTWQPEEIWVKNKKI